MKLITVMPCAGPALIRLTCIPVHRRQSHVRTLKLSRRTALRAGEEPSSVEPEEDAEERITRLEAAARGARRPDSGQVPDVAQDDSASTKKRQWKEGELLPEGWEDLSLAQKAWELYAGERGALFWANKVAFAAAIFLGVAWILFRFIGPNLGLYELKSTFTS